MKRLVLEKKSDIINQIQDYLEKNSEAKFIHRLQAIFLFATNEDESCDSLCARFGSSPRSISNWIKRINRSGSIESLRSKPQPGRSPRLTAIQKKEIRSAMEDLPEKRGVHGKRWNGKNLSLYISQYYGITLKERTCQRLFHELGVGRTVSP